MVAFAGWEMPIYFNGEAILSSVAHTRTAASIFDVSHMLQTRSSRPELQLLNFVGYQGRPCCASES